MDQERMGDERRQPPRAALRNYEGRKKTARGGNRKLGANRRDRHAPPGSQVMTAIRTLLARLASVFGRSRRDAELSDEIASHLEQLTAEHARRGLSLSEARAAARRDFGGIEQMKERYRDRRALPILDTLRQ